MMNTIAKINSSRNLRAPATDIAARDALDAARNLLFRDYPAMPAMLEQPLAPTARERLECRRQALANCLAPTSRAELPQMAAAIAGMLGGFGAGTASSADALVARYVMVLKDLPLWAVTTACDAIERGQVEGVSLDFRPAVARLWQVARSFMAPWEEEASHLRDVLEAEALGPENEEMRKRVGELLGGFATDFKAGKFKELPIEDLKRRAVA